MSPKLNKTQQLVLRLMYVADQAPYAMDTVIKFKNGADHGTIRWLANESGIGRKRIVRWIAHTFQAQVSTFTSAVMQEIYGLSYITTPADKRKEKHVIRYCWNADFITYYHGFSSVKAMNKWLSIHGDWIEDWQQIR